MAGKRRSQTVRDLMRYSRHLLYEATDGSIGEKLESKEKKSNDIDFTQKRALLDTMLKIAALEHKIEPEEHVSGLDSIKELLNGGSEIKGRGNGRSIPGPRELPIADFQTDSGGSDIPASESQQ